MVDFKGKFLSMNSLILIFSLQWLCITLLVWIFFLFPNYIFPGSMNNRWCHLCRCEKLEGLSLCFCIGLCSFISIAFRFFTIWWLQEYLLALCDLLCRIFKLYCLFLSFASQRSTFKVSSLFLQSCAFPKLQFTFF